MERHETLAGAGVMATRPRPPRVLVADDDPAIRLICATWLSLDGYEVIEATNGQDALDLALTGAPDAVLLDISMPTLDGFDVAAALRADDRTRDVPLVFLTGETGPHVTERAEELGAAGFFTKPFDPDTVAAFIRNVIEGLTTRSTPAAAGGHAF